MKEICKLIGALVLILALAIFVLFKLNGMGFISGSLGTWTTNVVYHLTAIKDDTIVFLHEEGIIKNAPAPATTPLPAQVPDSNVTQPAE